MSDDVFYHISNIMNVDQAEIAKIVHSYLERDIGCEYDRMNCPAPPIYIGPVKIKTLKERLEEIKMKKATSVQNIKNVRDIIFSIDNYPMETESKLTIVASTDDDIFEFKFEGSDLLQSCKKAGLFTGWEKDQKIRELEKENKKLKDAYNNVYECVEHVSKEKQQLKEDYEEKQQQLKEDYEEQLKDLQREYYLEKAANEAQHKFIREYAGKGTEVQFNYAIDDVKEVSYVIVDKEEYQSLKDRNKSCIPSKMINRVHELEETNKKLKYKIAELEELQTPTIENFADEKPSTRADILDQAKKCVCGHREQDYGTPESNFQLIANLWNQYLFKDCYVRETFGINAKDVAMLMSLMKIARIRNGGGSGDSFVDLAGYAACGGEIWALQKETN